MRKSDLERLPNWIKQLLSYLAKLALGVVLLGIVFVILNVMTYENINFIKELSIIKIISRFLGLIGLLLGSIEKYIKTNPTLVGKWIITLIISIDFIFILLHIIERLKIKKGALGKDKYWSKLPDELPPYAAAWLLERKKGDLANMIAGEITILIDDGYITPVKIKDTYCYFFNKTMKASDGYWKYQMGFFNMLYYDIAKGKGQLSLSDFNKLSDQSNKSTDILKRMFFSLSLGVNNELIEKGYKKNPKEAKGSNISVIHLLIGFAVAYLLFILTPIFLIYSAEINWILVLIAYIGILFALFSTKHDLKDDLTSKGVKSYYDWCSFRRFLENYSKFQDRGIRDIILWHDVIAYAAVFNLSEKLSKDVKYSGVEDLVQILVKAMRQGKIIQFT